MPNIFSMYTYSSSHFGMMMSYDVTGGGPMEAPIFSTCTQIDPITFSLEDIHKNVKNQKFYSLWLLHCNNYSLFSI